jgi:hypothetical protein
LKKISDDLSLSTPFWEFLALLVIDDGAVEEIVPLSTPFWEFHINVICSISTFVHMKLSTPFWEFLMKSAGEGMGALTLSLSTPFWEFLLAELSIQQPSIVSTVSFYSLFGVSSKKLLTSSLLHSFRFTFYSLLGVSKYEYTRKLY